MQQPALSQSKGGIIASSVLRVIHMLHHQANMPLQKICGCQLQAFLVCANCQNGWTVFRSHDILCCYKLPQRPSQHFQTMFHVKNPVQSGQSRLGWPGFAAQAPAFLRRLLTRRRWLHKSGSLLRQGLLAILRTSHGFDLAGHLPRAGQYEGDKIPGPIYLSYPHLSLQEGNSFKVT